MVCPEAKAYLGDIRDILAAAYPPVSKKGSLASKYLEHDRIGFQTRKIVSTVALSTTPKLILTESVDRWSWKVINPDAAISEFAWFDSSVATNNGIVLLAGGGNAGMSLKNDGMLTEAQVWAVAASGTPNLFVVEEVLI